ncbi:preprotein translocase subunit SecF [Marmoricola sp. Leaf446]|uniref:protein translocase subunit SecF n=1 Tax=Marmoricola sp. Leaf446 TaxID=1736379 RepID=UPI0006FD5DBD|nr:protein translocase subunit SecF [Marmoricola sp. Leaf446]KQT94513.1 preprotein translocase subunit SecF [Marmoricola sp. Leaf446]
MGRMSRLGNRLYEGDTSIDFVGRKWLWYAVSAVIMGIAVTGLLVRGLNFGIEFEGGVEYQVNLPANEVTQENADVIRSAVADTGLDAASAPIVNTSGTDSIRVQTEEMSNDDATEVRDAIAEAVGVDARTDISTQEVGASWGQQVAERALLGLVVFLVLVVLFIWAYMREWKMSVAALVALAHDLVITIGIYAISGFEVTPATVTGVLTILGFSLYDTVVVFDKVKENTRTTKGSRRTYAEQANLAVNQTLVRSINTSIVALLPVGAILYVGVATLGTGALKDLALSLFVGMAAGAYSSIFIATPLAVHLKQGEKEIKVSDARAKARSRRNADRYAEVPVFHEGMPVVDEDAAYDDPDDPDAEPRDDRAPAGPVRAPARRPEASGSGRIAPEAHSALRDGGAAKRSQPTRQPRSKRQK